MNAPATTPIHVNPHKPINLAGQHFADNRWDYYRYLREHLPVHKSKLLGLTIYVTARYDDCLTLMKDERFGRNRANITGGKRLPFPMPKSVRYLSESMITEDDPEHRRLRQLVQKAFSPKSLSNVEKMVTDWAEELADDCARKGEFNVQEDFAVTVPARAIGAMMGIDGNEIDEFRHTLNVLSEGLSGWRIARTMFWDLRKVSAFVANMIERKKKNLGDDILSGLIEADIEGDRLTEQELITMVFLLVIAGFETTSSLISNGVVTFGRHRDQLHKLQAHPELWGSAVEELLRFSGPVQGTKMNYAKEDIELRGVTIPKGQPAMPLIGSANRDESVFADPDRFDVKRDPNKHLAFSQGNHFCLGAFLARMETKIAFKALYDRMPDLEIVDEPRQVAMPGWYRYKDYRVRAG